RSVNLSTPFAISRSKQLLFPAEPFRIPDIARVSREGHSHKFGKGGDFDVLMRAYVLSTSKRSTRRTPAQPSNVFQSRKRRHFLLAIDLPQHATLFGQKCSKTNQKITGPREDEKCRIPILVTSGVAHEDRYN